MAPQPPPSNNFTPDFTEQMRRGKRRNFYEERTEHPHRFPLRTRVFMQTPAMRFPIGPMYIVEHCKPLFRQGPPQYILQPCMDGDNSKWLMANELHIYEVDENDEPVPITD